MTREEMLACLEDRPCNVCKYHTEKGCERWSCVFEEEPDDTENKGEWIPIEEGKPKHKQMVFVTYDHEGEIKVDKTMYHERHGFAISPNVIAWRDIQPYKKGE